jgi:hypothetical protein
MELIASMVNYIKDEFTKKKGVNQTTNHPLLFGGHTNKWRACGKRTRKLQALSASAYASISTM